MSKMSFKKKYSSWNILLYAYFLIALCSPLFIIAQTTSQANVPPEESKVLPTAFEQAPPAGTVSCFENYRFGSVQVNLTTSLKGTVSGAPIFFSGAIENENGYPIVDGALYVKIFKIRSDDDANGHDVVDQFLVEGDIVIPANGSVPISFQWRVPSYAQTGEYEVATFFTTSRKFNLLGLSFTDDIVGNTVPFSIIGENETGITFDKAGVTIDGKGYLFAAFPPRTDSVSPVTLSAQVDNTTGKPEQATISWSVYQWDAQLRENAVQEQVVKVTVPPGGARFSITIADTKYPVYYVVGTLFWKDTKSVIGARFVREGVDRTRINFPGIASFPLKAGEPNTLFSCLHNAGSSVLVRGGSLDLTLLDRSGNIIEEYRYDGDVTGAMMGVAKTFTAQKDYDYFTLTASLFENGQFVDDAHLVYDCAQIDPALCAPEEQKKTGSRFFDDLIRLILPFALGLATLIGALWIYRRLSSSSRTAPLPPL